MTTVSQGVIHVRLTRAYNMAVLWEKNFCARKSIILFRQLMIFNFTNETTNFVAKIL